MSQKSNDTVIPKEQLLNTLKNLKVISSDDHFVLRSGRHTSQYINKDNLYKRPDYTSYICKQIAIKLLATMGQVKIETVIAPATGGIPMSQWLAYHLQKLQGSTVFAAYAEKNTDIVDLKEQLYRIGRTYSSTINLRNIVIADDVLTTGGSMQKVIQAVEQSSGKIIACIAIFNRGKITNEMLGVPQLFSLFDIEIKTYESDNCPMCKQNIPINTELGHYTRKA